MDDLQTTSPADEPIIVMTRTFAAPRALVWKAWTDPKHIAKWWGWRHSRTEIAQQDLRPGGVWRYVSYNPDGQQFVFVGKFLEVVEPERLVNTFGVEGMFEGKELVETHTFEEIDGRTHYRSVSRFDSIEDRDGMLASGMEGGARESMNRMDELLRTM